MKRASLFLSLGAIAVSASSTSAQAHAAPTTPKVINVALASIPGHPDNQAPFDAVFSTNAPLHQIRDDEGTKRLPGGVGIDGPAAMRVYPTAEPHHHSGNRWCYAAEASSRVWSKLHAGRTYAVQVALSDDDSAPRTKVTRSIRTRTIQDAARALGC